MKASLDDLIAEAKRAREESSDPAKDFKDETDDLDDETEDATPPLYQNEETEDDDAEDVAPVVVKKTRAKSNPAKLSIQLDKTAEGLTEALYKLTAAINAIAPRAPQGEPQRGEAPAVKISVTVNVDATPLVDRLTDGVSAVVGGEGEGVLSRALRETLKDFNAPSVGMISKKDASQFLTILARRLDDAKQTRALDFEPVHPEAVARETIAPEPSQSVKTPEPVTSAPEDKPQRVEAPRVDPQREDVTDEDATNLVKRIKNLVGGFESQDRPKLTPILSRFGVGLWDDIPRDKLAEACDAVASLKGFLYGEGNNPTA